MLTITRSHRSLRALLMLASLGLATSGIAGAAAQPDAGATAAATPAAPDAAATGAADAVTAVDDPLLKRAIEVSTAIKTYQATIHADVAFRTFPFITTHLDGNVYFKAPDREAVVFDTIPLFAGTIKKFYPNVPAPSRWSALYLISSLGEVSGLTTYRLVPKKHGRVEHLDVRIDDAKAVVTSYMWTYEDGGDITFDQTFVMVSGHPVVATQTGKVELPSYKGDVTSKIGDYKLNVPVADSVFDEPK